MKNNSEVVLARWTDSPPNASVNVEINGYDNGDGEGPHYFDLKLNTMSGGEFSSTITVCINSLKDLEALAATLNRACAKAKVLMDDAPVS